MHFRVKRKSVTVERADCGARGSGISKEFSQKSPDLVDFHQAWHLSRLEAYIVPQQQQPGGEGAELQEDEDAEKNHTRRRPPADHPGRPAGARRPGGPAAAERPANIVIGACRMDIRSPQQIYSQL